MGVSSVPTGIQGEQGKGEGRGGGRGERRRDGDSPYFPFL